MSPDGSTKARLTSVAPSSNQLLGNRRRFQKTEEYPIGVYVLPKHLDEKVARLQLAKLDVELTKLSEEQASYIGVDRNGPYKPDEYRY